MGWGIIISQRDSKDRKQTTEFWLRMNHIAVHYHGWLDSEDKKLAESCTRYRKFKENYYVAMETIVPFYVVKKLVFSPTVFYQFVKWFIKAWRDSKK